MSSSATQPTNPHHDGKLFVEFKVDDDDEEKKMKIKPHDLKIVWGKDSRYWNVPEDDESAAAELFQVSWLEVTGCVSKTDPDKEYEVGFNISLTPDAFGWSSSPVYILAKRGKSGKFTGKKLTLEPQIETDIKTKVAKLESKDKDDKDKEKDDDENSKLYFGLYEVWRGKWKGGLKIHHAFIQQI